MNTRLQLYLSGAPYLTRMIATRKGNRVAVLNPRRRQTAAARNMRQHGFCELAIAMTLKIDRQLLAGLLSGARRRLPGVNENRPLYWK